MFLRRLELQEFRSFRRLDLALEPVGLRLVGPNASGKSTLLEAVMMLATTRSPRTSSERDTINWESGEEYAVPPFARIAGVVERSADQIEIEIGLEADPARPSAGRKRIKLNGRPVRALDAVGALRAVLFSPEDVGLIPGPPAGRRRYLDLAISQVDGTYLRALSRFSQVLIQRNSLLKSLARDRVAPGAPAVAAQLDFWDGELIAVGSVIIARRLAVVAEIDLLARERFGALAGSDDFVVHYNPALDLDGLRESGAGVRDASLILPVVRREYEAALIEARPAEVRRGVSLIGPHREDLSFTLGGKDLAVFGSRGQQRLAVVALKLAEVALMGETAGEAPLLLLDDVLSELDAGHRAAMIEGVVERGVQLLVTTTDRDLLSLPVLAHLPLVGVASGAVIPAVS